MSETLGPKVIVALDHPSLEDARSLVSQLNPELCRLKIGNILFTHYGPSIIEEFMKKGFSIFLDLKFHDIPQTVAGACRSAAALGVWMVNVHVQGGQAMLAAARNEIDRIAGKKPLLIGVTVLTSMDDADLKLMGMTDSVVTLVPRFAKLAQDSGLDGVVCSAQEASILRSQLHENFLLVTPGIRLATSDKGDQKRIMTPKAAIEAGANYLVIGRPITQVKNPLEVLQQIHTEIIG
ncbi:orotidine-5'-phosphate decarboxylase [Candidiatus Paracoxiella cheracis]|uniref:orotidine-5'-phosphate decarboxylase n=1 Tax=Candidiatus Paracoxiella cheracis TaxID=3405120 RepID=UPI003BF4F99D